MHFEWDFTEPPGVTPQQIVETWASPDFYAELAGELELDDHEVDIQYEPGTHLHVTLRLVVSVAGVPSTFRQLLGVGDSMAITWPTDLRRDGESFRGEMPARTDDGKLTLETQTSLEQVPDGVHWPLDGPLNLKMRQPIKTMAERALVGLLKDVLKEQAKVTQRRLAQPGNDLATG
jgi:hypothetical protein